MVLEILASLGESSCFSSLSGKIVQEHKVLLLSGFRYLSVFL